MKTQATPQAVTEGVFHTLQCERPRQALGDIQACFKLWVSFRRRGKDIDKYQLLNHQTEKFDMKVERCHWLQEQLRIPPESQPFFVYQVRFTPLLSK
jgi:hypothetical protein